MDHIVKTFPGVVALDDVNLVVHRQEIHAICGENGAGKSTLMKVLSGVHPAGTYKGTIEFDGKPVSFANLRQSEEAGIAIIHQELALIPELSIAENMFIGNEKASGGVINWKETRAATKKYLALVGLKEDPDTKIKDLGVGKQQLIEIAKALAKKCRLLIGAIDGSQLGSQLEQARAAGIKIVAYDRLLTNTKNIDYYIAYDNFHVGELQDQALLEGLAKEKGASPYKIEVFGGSPDDSNSLKFFNGAMSALKPKIDDGTLVIGSGQAEFSQTAAQGWDPKNAQTRIDSLLASTYPGTEAPAGVLSPNDTLARAVLTSIGEKRERPVVTGQDSEDESVTLVAKGVQYSTK